MQRQSYFNLDGPGIGNQSGSPDLHEEVTALEELLTQTRTEMSRIRQRLDRRQVEIDSHARRANVLSGIVIVAVISLAAVIWYGLPMVRAKEDYSVRLSAMQALVDSTQGRLSMLESKVNSNTPVPDSAPLQAPVKAEFPSAKPKAANENEADENVRSIPSRALVAAAADSTRTRVDFEVLRNKTEEVAPGIYLTIRSADGDRQRIDGWIQIADEGRMVFLRDQGTQSATSFTTKHDARSRDLVITQIDKSGIAGYVLIPRGTAVGD